MELQGVWMYNFINKYNPQLEWGAAPFPAGSRSLLEFAESCDVPARWSCRTGVCHTCVTPVLSGRLSYSPDPLEPPSGGQALICW